ncbi:DUF441 domain-containing protein [Ligilactobacillus ceti]|uniref:UPF0756 membrane protein IV53_GL000868 n=1 Tax=Ligilactobacillus ceti DSM 22408 TaxID=1122146 RepID=A0A0R2KHT0_9LACO|nr:DUF441 domain-containing protein [Ligilactobacillus ceti]KRN88898.1 hypothetical protein IV53_GL000868 [Ligilactobacillus ceti DSM 22408]
MESWLFLAVILVVALFGKNMSLIIASSVVILIKLLPISDKLFPLIHAKGINWGVTIISIAILIPIATGQIGFKDLLEILKSPVGWIALACGALVAILSKNGVSLLATSPQITVVLVFGTIIGVVFFKGIASGPVIASGITYCIVSLLNLSLS